MNPIPNQTGTINQAFSLDLSTFVTLTNADPILSYQLASGTLPAGVSLNTTTGLLSGTPTQEGIFSVSVTATDNDGTSNAAGFNLTINGIPPVFNTVPNQTGTVNQVFSLDLSTFVTLTNADPILSYQLASGTLPAGVSLNTTTGLLSGTPTQEGIFLVSVTATDNDGASNAAGFNLTINGIPPVFNTIPNQTGTVNQVFSLDLSTFVTLTNADPILSYQLASGTLPAGVSLNASNGLLSGTPTQEGIFSVSVTATDNDGTSNAINFNLTINGIPPVFNPVPNQTGTVNQVFSVDLSTFVTLTNADPILSYQLASGTLPAGVSLNTTTGLLSGTPTQEGVFSVSVTATDNDGTSNAINFNLTINGIPPVFNTVPNQTGTVNQAFSLDLSTFVTLTNTDPILSYQLASGTLPTGVSLNAATGLLSGTPTQEGVFSVSVTATDNDGTSNIATFELEILDHVGLSELSTVDIQIFPNPTSDYITIVSAENMPFVTYEINAQDGKQLERGEIANGALLNLQNLNTGVYFLKIIHQNKIKVFKINKQ